MSYKPQKGWLCNLGISTMIVTNYKIISSDYMRLDGVKKAVFLLETDKGVVNLECSVNCEVGSEAELTTRLLMDAKRQLERMPGYRNREKTVSFRIAGPTQKISLVA